MLPTRLTRQLPLTSIILLGSAWRFAGVITISVASFLACLLAFLGYIRPPSPPFPSFLPLSLSVSFRCRTSTSSSVFLNFLSCRSAFFPFQSFLLLLCFPISPPPPPSSPLPELCPSSSSCHFLLSSTATFLSTSRNVPAVLFLSLSVIPMAPKTSSESLPPYFTGKRWVSFVTGVNLQAF